MQGQLAPSLHLTLKMKRSKNCSFLRWLFSIPHITFDIFCLFSPKSFVHSPRSLGWVLLRCVLGRLPWSAKVKPRPDETWEEGAHGAAVVYLVVFAGGWKRLGSLWDTVGHPFTIGWRHLNEEKRCVCLPPCMAQDWKEYQSCSKFWFRAFGVNEALSSCCKSLRL